MKTSLWSLLKDTIGRDLSRVALPVNFNEPTSFLQRAAEDFQYSKYLDSAAFALKGEGPGSSHLIKLKLSRAQEAVVNVALFVSSAYASVTGRTYKPFNPLLGETYELSHLGYKYIAEQTSHHPPIVSYHAEGDGWKAGGFMNVENSFTGKSLSVHVRGPYHIEVENTSGEWDKYEVMRPPMSVDNIIFGQMKIEVYGQSCIYCTKTNSNILFEWYPSGWFHKERRLRALLWDDSGPYLVIEGAWTDKLYARKVVSYLEEVKLPPIDCTKMANAKKNVIMNINWNKIILEDGQGILIHEAEPRPKWAPNYYEFGLMTFQLNEMTEHYRHVPFTDSRLRPDQYYLEQGDVTSSNNQKVRLEEKQRERARDRKTEDNYLPVWFDKVAKPGGGWDFFYKGTYFDCAEQIKNNELKWDDVIPHKIFDLS